jgi:hypothetical protein
MPTVTGRVCFLARILEEPSRQRPGTELQLGNVTYNQQELLSILHQPVRGNGLVLVAHHEIAAKLNVASGADGSCIAQTLAAFRMPLSSESAPITSVHSCSFVVNYGWVCEQYGHWF